MMQINPSGVIVLQFLTDSQKRPHWFHLPQFLGPLQAAMAMPVSPAGVFPEVWATLRMI